MREVKYKSSYEKYILPDSLSDFATAEEIISTDASHTFTINAQKYPTGGIPLVTEGDSVTVISDDSHTLIYGETGSKKTRCCIKPLIMFSIGAGESLIVTDPKGELAEDAKTDAWLKQHQYTKVVLDFRDFAGDGHNILQYPYELYCKGEKDKAMACVLRLTSALSKKNRNEKDPFWTVSAENQLVSTILLLFETCRRTPDYNKYLNIQTLGAFVSLSTYSCGDDGDGGKYAILETIVESITKHTSNLTIQNLQSIFNAPRSRTRPSIEVSTNSLIKDFLYHEALLKTLSVSTFDVRKAYKEPMCIFLVIPDETSAFDDIAGVMIDNIYSQLIDVHRLDYQDMGITPERSVSFICDEFCNIFVNDMASKISASRSRDIRWYLVCQSLAQLKSSYKEAAGTIIDNCKNTFLLQSSDHEMLSYISNQCGTTNLTHDGRPRPLITPEQLNRMEKHRDYKDALFIRDHIRFCARLPDIDTYNFLKEPGDLKPVKAVDRVSDTRVEVYTPAMMLDDLDRKIILLPFTDCYFEYEEKVEETYSEDEREVARRILDTTFGDEYEYEYEYNKDDEDNDETYQ